MKTLNNDFGKSLAVLSFAAVIIVIGLPVWWKTTETFRVPLPYKDIEALRTTQLSFKVKIDVIFVDESIDKTTWDNLENAVVNELKPKNLDGSIQENYAVAVRFSNKVEKQALRSTTTVEGLGEALSKEQSFPGKYFIYIFPPDRVLSGHTTETFISRYRFAYVKSSLDTSHVASTIKNIVQNVFIDRESLQISAANIQKPHLIKPDKRIMRTLLSSPEYDITFSLMNPEPDAFHAQWKISQAVKSYLNPLLAKLNSVAKFHTRSQVLYLTSLGVFPLWDSELKRYCLTAEQLPHIINPIEAKLGSFVSTNPSLNFIVYVPSRDQAPLHILDPKDGSLLPTNAFLIPRWGGIIVKNVASPVNGTSFPITIEIGMHSVMETFVTQLRLLLGLTIKPSDNAIQFESFDRSSIADWELDYLYRKRALENIATTTSTLASLAQLLETIGNIVINEKVGNFVFAAVESTKSSFSLLAEADIQDGFLASKQGYISSENAFFDPSMLALLYFPDDQKYAVYVPLFIPVGIPVLLSLVAFFRSVREGYKKRPIKA